MDNDFSVLLVEDNPIDQENIKRAFWKNQIMNPLFVANDGIEALHMLEGHRGYEALSPTPKILLLDVNMPRMSGLELLSKLRCLPEFKQMIAYVLTTSDAEKDIFEANFLDVAGYIVKPLSIDGYVEVLASLKVYWDIKAQDDPKPN